MGKWNFDDIENSLVSDAENRITRAYTAEDNAPATAPARGQSLGSVPMPTDSPQAAERPVIQPTSQPPASQIIGLKGPDTKGVQTYLPLKDYMRLMQQKTLRKQNIAQIAGEAIIDWLDRQEQSPQASAQK